jgi:hypothetical protein
MLLGDFDRYKAAALRAAQIKSKKGHPIFDNLPVFPPKF